MNRNCSACNIMIDIDNYKKDRTVCKTCYKKNKRKNNNNTLPPNKINTSYQQPNIGNVNNKNKLKLMITKTTTLILQHMKTIVVSLSALAT